MPVFVVIRVFVSKTVLATLTSMVIVFPVRVRISICFCGGLAAVVKASTLFPPQASVVKDAKCLHEASEADDDRTPQSDNRRQDVFATVRLNHEQVSRRGTATLPHKVTKATSAVKRSMMKMRELSFCRDNPLVANMFVQGNAVQKDSCLGKSVGAP